MSSVLLGIRCFDRATRKAIYLGKAYINGIIIQFVSDVVMEPREGHFIVCDIDISMRTGKTYVPDQERGNSRVTKCSFHSWEYEIQLKYIGLF